MFTGIVAAVGRIADVESLADSAGANDAGVRLTIDAGVLDLADVRIGDSIAINGACMTVIEKTAATFKVDVSRESLRCTSGLGKVGEVNLEKALTLADRLGGHLVSGHVDGIGEVLRFEPTGESWTLVIRAPQDLGKYFAVKGSATVNGVSLTVNNVRDTPAGTEFSINLIPHTLSATTLHALVVGAKVNLEVDLMARYVERMLSLSGAGASDSHLRAGGG